MSKYSAFYCDLARLGIEIADRPDDAALGSWLRRVHRAIVMEASGVEPYADFIMESVDAERADWRLQNYRAKAAKTLKGQGVKKPTPGQVDSLVAEMYPELNFSARVDSSVEPVQETVEMESPRASAPHVSRPPVDPVIRDTFEVFRKAYAGQKNGLDCELQVFMKACSKFGYDPAAEVARLLPAWERENTARLTAGLDNAFFPQVKNLKTWLNNACWLQELPSGDPVAQLSQADRVALKIRMKEAGNV